jgi:hypothetical protein
LDGLLQLATKRRTRAELILRRAYPIIRDYDLWETDEAAKDKVAAIADLLIRDSEGDGKVPVARPLVTSPAIMPAPIPEPEKPKPKRDTQPEPIEGVEDL